MSIHGAADTYIKPAMARTLVRKARGPVELWLVEGAKHNQSHVVAGAQYHRRLVEFFDTHLGGGLVREVEKTPAPRHLTSEVVLHQPEA